MKDRVQHLSESCMVLLKISKSVNSELDATFVPQDTPVTVRRAGDDGIRRTWSSSVHIHQITTMNHEEHIHLPLSPFFDKRKLLSHGGIQGHRKDNDLGNHIISSELI